MIARADIRRVRECMGHAHIQTTMKYLHYAPREEDAALVAEAFATTHLAPTPSHKSTNGTPLFRSSSPVVIGIKTLYALVRLQVLPHVRLGRTVRFTRGTTATPLGAERGDA